MSFPANRLLACLALLCAAAATPAGPPCQRDAERVAAVLAETYEGPEALAERTDALVALGPQAVGALLDALAEGRFPLSPQPAEGEPQLGTLDPERREAVLAGLATISPTAVRAHLGALRREAPPDALRCAGLEVYGRMGKPDDLPAMVALATPVEPGALIAPAVRSAFRAALDELLARQPATLERVREAFEPAHPGLRAALIDGVRGARPEGGLAVLETLLGAGPELDLLVLSGVADLARHATTRVGAGLLDEVRGYLSSQDPRLVLASARAAGELRDPRAVPELIALLGSTDPGLRARADEALQRIAGRDFHGEAERWHAWYDGEQRWWAGAESWVREGLRSSSPALNARALNEVSAHRLFCRELELALVERLGLEDPLLVSMACSALGRLGSRAGVAELDRFREHPDPRVAQAARDALARILGEPGRP